VFDKETWGPSDAVLQQAAAFESQGSWYNAEEDSDSQGESTEADSTVGVCEPDGDMDNEDYSELLDAFETQALTDAYRGDGEFLMDGLVGIDSMPSWQPHVNNYSPQKRSRVEVD
jgi:hypothetical protein